MKVTQAQTRRVKLTKIYPKLKSVYKGTIESDKNSTWLTLLLHQRLLTTDAMKNLVMRLVSKVRSITNITPYCRFDTKVMAV